MGHLRQMKAVSAHRLVYPNNNHIVARNAVVERYPLSNHTTRPRIDLKNPRSTVTWKMSGNVRRALGLM